MNKLTIRFSTLICGLDWHASYSALLFISTSPCYSYHDARAGSTRRSVVNKTSRIHYTDWFWVEICWIGYRENIESCFNIPFNRVVIICYLYIDDLLVCVFYVIYSIEIIYRANNRKYDAFLKITFCKTVILTCIFIVIIMKIITVFSNGSMLSTSSNMLSTLCNFQCKMLL